MLWLSEDGVLGVIAMSGVRVLRGLGFFIITHQLSYVILLIVDNVLIAHVTQLLKGQLLQHLLFLGRERRVSRSSLVDDLRHLSRAVLRV